MKLYKRVGGQAGRRARQNYGYLMATKRHDSMYHKYHGEVPILLPTQPENS